MSYFINPFRLRRASADDQATPDALSSDDNVGRGMDIALTFALFVVAGALLDAWLSTAPLFTIGLIAVAAVGTFLKMKYSYDAKMEILEAERRERRSASPAGRTEGPA